MASRFIKVTAAMLLLGAGVMQTQASIVNQETISNPDSEWLSYGRNYKEQRFSPLDKINRDNVDELDLEGKDPLVQRVREHAERSGARVVCVCAKLEAEIAELDEQDRAEMLSEAGLEYPALSQIAREAYHTLGLQSYFTAGEKEVRAWTVPVGATAPQAAGVIHTDFEKGFIRVEVYTLDDLETHESEKEIRQAGKLRVEGKNYVMQDGDICHFLFNV